MGGEPMGSAHHRTAGLGHPHLHDGRQLLHRDRRGAGRRRGGRDRVGRALPAALSMATSITTDLIERVTPMVRDLVTSRSRAHLRYADLRLEVIEGKYAAAENGEAKGDRKSTRLNSSHRTISYAVFCLKKKK